MEAVWVGRVEDAEEGALVGGEVFGRDLGGKAVRAWRHDGELTHSGEGYVFGSQEAYVQPVGARDGNRRARVERPVKRSLTGRRVEAGVLQELGCSEPAGPERIGRPIGCPIPEGPGDLACRFLIEQAVSLHPRRGFAKVLVRPVSTQPAQPSSGRGRWGGE